MAVEAWQPNAATGWWILADQTADIYWALLALLACGVSGAIQKESQSCPAIVEGRWRGWITSKGK
jgi:hypothetical protein